MTPQSPHPLLAACTSQLRAVREKNGFVVVSPTFYYLLASTASKYGTKTSYTKQTV